MVNVCYVALDDKDILNLGEKLLNVAEVLDYVIPAFYRSNGGRDVFKNIRVTEQAFMNQCNEAVHAFGSILKKKMVFLKKFLMQNILMLGLMVHSKKIMVLFIV